MATDRSIAVTLRTRDAASTRLLESGLRVFGELGFHAVSTRQLAQSAGVNVAAIPYYFGGKEGYYLAVVRRLVDFDAAPLREAAAELHRRLAEPPAAQVADQTFLRSLLAAFVQNVQARLEATHIAAFVLREQLQPTAAFEVLYEGLLRPMHDTLRLLVARLTGCANDDLAAVVQAHAMLGQLLALTAGRATLLRALDLPQDALGQFDRVTAISVDLACRAFDAPRPCTQFATWGDQAPEGATA